jgi:AraC family transcriptional regulator
MIQNVITREYSLTDAGPANNEYLGFAEIHKSALERVITAMHQNFSESFSLNDMADVACLSPYYFNRLFHRIIGLPPCEFLSALRLGAAKKLLLTTDMSVTDICFAVGYNALGSFTSRFTQNIGFSPRHLRLRLQQLGETKRATSDQSREGATSLEFSRPSLVGRIETPGLSEGLIFVGVFSKPIPQGKPTSCTMLTAPGPFRLGPIPPGWYYLLAAAFPLSHDPRLTLFPASARLVGISGPLYIQERAECTTVEFCLRPSCLTDPPILTALFG